MSGEPEAREEKWAVSSAVFDELAERPDSVPVAVFMADHGLDRIGLRELLREFRAESGWSPFEYGRRDELAADFLNWHEWERLG